jgi:hypothetical protein
MVREQPQKMALSQFDNFDFFEKSARNNSSDPSKHVEHRHQELIRTLSVRLRNRCIR